MYARMLVPLDGSPLAEIALFYAKEIAARLDMDVLLLQVYTPQEAQFLPMHQAYLQGAAEKVTNQAAQVWQSLGEGTQARVVRTRLVEGHPAEMILEVAEQEKVDFILMPTHGRSGIRRWTMGSVADKVLRASTVPVWLVRAGISEEMLRDELPTKAIVVPLDGSELAEAVLPHVEDLAKQKGGEPPRIVLLRVLEPPTIPYDGGSDGTDWGPYIETVEEANKQATEEYLPAVAKRLSGAGLLVTWEILKGDAAGAIVDYACRTPHCLIAMSTHGRGGVLRFMYGSVTDRVLHSAECPVFIVRPLQ